MPIKDPEKRREYERLRNQSPARKERDRLRNQTQERKDWEKKRAPSRRQYKVNRQKEYREEVLKDFPLYNRATQIRTRCKKNNTPCDIDGPYLRGLYESQGRVCAVTCLRFDERPHMRASVDRIKPHLGYTKGNIRIILSCVNSLKADDDNDEWVLITAQAILSGPLSDSPDSMIQSDNPVLPLESDQGR